MKSNQLFFILGIALIKFYSVTAMSPDRYHELPISKSGPVGFQNKPFLSLFSRTYRLRSLLELFSQRDQDLTSQGMNRKHVFILDVDGVIYDEHQRILKDKDALQKFLLRSREYGIPVYLCSASFTISGGKKIAIISQMLRTLDSHWPQYVPPSSKQDSLNGLSQWTLSEGLFSIFQPYQNIVTATEGNARGRVRKDIAIRKIIEKHGPDHIYYFVDDFLKNHQNIQQRWPQEIPYPIKCFLFNDRKEESPSCHYFSSSCPKESVLKSIDETTKNYKKIIPIRLLENQRKAINLLAEKVLDEEIEIFFSLERGGTFLGDQITKKIANKIAFDRSGRRTPLIHVSLTKSYYWTEDSGWRTDKNLDVKRVIEGMEQAASLGFNRMSIPEIYWSGASVKLFLSQLGQSQPMIDFCENPQNILNFLSLKCLPSSWDVEKIDQENLVNLKAPNLKPVPMVYVKNKNAVGEDVDAYLNYGPNPLVIKPDTEEAFLAIGSEKVGPNPLIKPDTEEASQAIGSEKVMSSDPVQVFDPENSKVIEIHHKSMGTRDVLLNLLTHGKGENFKSSQMAPQKSCVGSLLEKISASSQEGSFMKRIKTPTNWGKISHLDQLFELGEKESADSDNNPKVFLLAVEGVLRNHDQKEFRDKNELKDFLKKAKDLKIPVYFFSDLFIHSKMVESFSDHIQKLHPEYAAWNKLEFLSPANFENLQIDQKKFTLFKPLDHIVTAIEFEQERSFRPDIAIRWIHQSLGGISRDYYYVDNRMKRCQDVFRLIPQEEIPDLKCVCFN